MKVGARLRGGEVIELVSDVGGGKTTFVRGLSSGAGSTDRVASPTFTVSKIYEAGHITIHHFDMYRIVEAGLMSHELGEVLEDSAAVLVVEWAEVIADVLPTERLTIRITKTGDESRTLRFTAAKTYEYLIEDVC